MSTKANIFTVVLHRDGINRPWGFRLAGGCDLDSPLIVTRVAVGSPSEGELQKGDIIKKIGDYDARDLRHTDALNLFQNAAGSINVVVQREVRTSDHRNGGASERSSSACSVPFAQQSPPVAGGVPTPFTTAGGRPAYERAQQSPVNNLCRFPPALIDMEDHDEVRGSPHKMEVEQEVHAVTEQPYRTTPLVLPGAKINKDPPTAVSYLRHHPNPKMRAHPGHYEWVPEEIARKQQVADSIIQRTYGDDIHSGKKVVLKQFNSPIGLYSEQNIANSVHAQTALTPMKKTVVFDPSKSETYKVLHETEYGNGVPEANNPVTPRVFTPVKPAPRKFQAAPSHTYNPNRASPQPHPTAPHPNADYGVHTEEIHQSNSFKRLMNMVMTDY